MRSAIWSLLLLAATAACSTTAKQSDAGSPPQTTPPPPAPARPACASSRECPEGQYCTVEDGACNRPPGCGPNDICPTVCYGWCIPRKPAVPKATGEPCGPTLCPLGQVCCNRSCGICTPPGGMCTQQFCGESAAQGSTGGACRNDADCRLFSDYCTGCDCRALSRGEKDPVCKGPGVRCVADPCQHKAAVCVAGKCALTRSGR